MISFLARIFIKNHNDTTSPKVRQAYGMLCGGVGIFLNILLFAGKATAGFLSGSIAITADAFNNLSDLNWPAKNPTPTTLSATADWNISQVL